MKINYSHSKNLHSVSGPSEALPVMLEGEAINSLLDVGCGGGTWLKSALEYEVGHVVGVDGVIVLEEELHVSGELIKKQNLTQPWDLGKRFDVVLCLEVAEHLSGEYSEMLIESLVKHADVVYFSAACPRQKGQHHVNCQWPEYWQGLFNEKGYKCDDTIRWKLWGMSNVEPWYRQNMFVAKLDPELAGTEPRIAHVIHPEMRHNMESASIRASLREHTLEIQYGSMPMRWYFCAIISAMFSKLKRSIKR